MTSVWKSGKPCRATQHRDARSADARTQHSIRDPCPSTLLLPLGHACCLLTCHGPALAQAHRSWLALPSPQVLKACFWPHPWCAQRPAAWQCCLASRARSEAWQPGLTWQQMRRLAQWVLAKEDPQESFLKSVPASAVSVDIIFPARPAAWTVHCACAFREPVTAVRMAEGFWWLPAGWRPMQQVGANRKHAAWSNAVRLLSRRRHLAAGRLFHIPDMHAPAAGRAAVAHAWRARRTGDQPLCTGHGPRATKPSADGAVAVQSSWDERLVRRRMRHMLQREGTLFSRRKVQAHAA